MAWLDDQLDFRWSDISTRTHFPLTSEGLQSCRAFPQIGVLDANADSPRYLPTVQGASVCRWDSTTQTFIETRPETQSALGRRQARFGNLIRSWGLDGAFITNWHDAQGWNYLDALPALHGTPVFQYSRRRSQRGQVVLIPLGWKYMGPGSDNLPSHTDPVPWEAKEPRLIWRGRCTGTVALEEYETWWAISSFRPGNDIAALRHLPQTARWRIAKALKDTPWADVKLTLSAPELNAVHDSPILSDLLSGLTGERVSQLDQYRAKFLLVVDGNDIGSNKYWSLLSNSVTLIVESEWETALDAGLEPWVHYVPVALEREAIEATVDELLSQPQRCRDIIQAAHALLRPQLDLALREAADFATLRRYADQVFSTASLPMRWSLARR